MNSSHQDTRAPRRLEKGHARKIYIPAVKYAVLEFFKSYLFDKKEMIAFELKKLKLKDKESQE